MKFVCDSCQQRYHVDDNRVGRRALRIRCKRCGAIVSVKNPEELESDESMHPARVAAVQRQPTRPSGHHRVVTGVQQSLDEIAWHYSVNGQSFGPFDEDDLIAKFLSGQIGDEAYVWNADMDGWRPAFEVPVFAPAIDEGKRRHPKHPTLNIPSQELEDLKASYLKQKQQEKATQSAPAPAAVSQAQAAVAGPAVQATPEPQPKPVPQHAPEATGTPSPGTFEGTQPGRPSPLRRDEAAASPSPETTQAAAEPTPASGADAPGDAALNRLRALRERLTSGDFSAPAEPESSRPRSSSRLPRPKSSVNLSRPKVKPLAAPDLGSSKSSRPTGPSLIQGPLDELIGGERNEIERDASAAFDAIGVGRPAARPGTDDVESIKAQSVEGALDAAATISPDLDETPTAAPTDLLQEFAADLDDAIERAESGDLPVSPQLTPSDEVPSDPVALVEPAVQPRPDDEPREATGEAWGEEDPPVGAQPAAVAADQTESDEPEAEIVAIEQPEAPEPQAEEVLPEGAQTADLPQDEQQPEALASEQPAAGQPDIDSAVGALAAQELPAEEPPAEAPATDEPPADALAADEPLAEEPAAEELATEAPAAEEPATEEPVADEPATEEPPPEALATEEPVADEPAADVDVSESIEEAPAQTPSAEELGSEDLSVEESVDQDPFEALAAERLDPADLDADGVDPEEVEVSEATEEAAPAEVLSAEEEAPSAQEAPAGGPGADAVLGDTDEPVVEFGSADDDAEIIEDLTGLLEEDLLDDGDVEDESIHMPPPMPSDATGSSPAADDSDRANAGAADAAFDEMVDQWSVFEASTSQELVAAEEPEADAPARGDRPAALTSETKAAIQKVQRDGRGARWLWVALLAGIIVAIAVVLPIVLSEDTDPLPVRTPEADAGGLADGADVGVAEGTGLGPVVAANPAGLSISAGVRDAKRAVYEARDESIRPANEAAISLAAAAAETLRLAEIAEQELRERQTQRDQRDRTETTAPPTQNGTSRFSQLDDRGTVAVSHETPDAEEQQTASSDSVSAEYFARDLPRVRAAVTRCHELQMRESRGTLLERVVVDITIQPNGDVALGLDSEINQTTFARCLRTRPQAWSFRRFEGEAVTLQQTYALQ